MNVTVSTSSKSVKQWQRYHRLFFMFKMAAVHHVGFPKIQISTAGWVWRASMNQHAKFYQKLSKGWIAYT